MINITLTNFFQILIVDYVANKLFSKKCPKIERLIIIVVCSSILTLFNYFGPNVYGSLIYVLVTFALVYISSSVTIVEGLMIAILQFINVSIGEFIAMSILSFITGLNKATDISSSPYTIALVFSLLFTYLLSHFSIRFFDLKKKYEFKYNQLTLVLPFITFLLILNIKDYFLLTRSYPIIIVIIIGLLSSNFIMLYLFFQSIKSIQLETELEISKNKMKLSKSYINLLNEQYENNFNYIHSLLHDIHLINESYKIKELNDIATKIDLHFNSMLTNSLALSTVLNRNMDSIDKNKIKVRTTVYEPFLNIDFEKKVAFFEELIKVGIDNCIDSQMEDRILIIQIKRINHLLVIRFVTPDKGFRINKQVCDYLNKNKIMDYSETVDKKLAIITYIFVIDD